MDLEERVREVAASVVAGEPEPFIGPRLTFNVDGKRGDRDAALAWLGRTPNQKLQVRVVSVKRNLTFVDWLWPGVGAGVAVVSWDQDGLVTDVMAQVRVKASAGASPAGE